MSPLMGSRNGTKLKTNGQPVLRLVKHFIAARYSEDPTIMAWNLINEPRCYQCPGPLQVSPPSTQNQRITS